MNKVWQPLSLSYWQTAPATNSGPLSLRRKFGTPRVRNNYSSTSTTAEAGIDGATLMARYSRVYSSPGLQEAVAKRFDESIPTSYNELANEKVD